MRFSPAGVRFVKTHQQIEAHRFSDAAAPEDNGGLARLNVKTHVVEDQIVVERFLDVLKFEIVLAQFGRCPLDFPSRISRAHW